MKFYYYTSDNEKITKNEVIIDDKKMEEFRSHLFREEEYGDSSCCARDLYNLVFGKFYCEKPTISFSDLLLELQNGTVEKKRKELEDTYIIGNVIAKEISNSWKYSDLDELIKKLENIKAKVSLLQCFNERDESLYKDVLRLINIKCVAVLPNSQFVQFQEFFGETSLFSSPESVQYQSECLKKTILEGKGAYQKKKLIKKD